MISKTPTAHDVKNMFDTLANAAVPLKKNNNHVVLDVQTIERAKSMIMAAEEELKTIDMFETSLLAINVVERLVLQNDFLPAFKILKGVILDLKHKINTLVEMRKLFDRL